MIKQKHINFLIVIIALFLSIILLGCNQEYIIEFIDYDNSVIETKKTNNIKDVNFPEMFRTGYTFVEWKTSEEKNKIVYKAHYNPKSYFISFNPNGGSEIENFKVNYDENIDNLPIPTKENKLFFGWKYDENILEIPFIYNFDKDIVLEAVWIDLVIVDFIDYDGTLIKSVKVENLEDAKCDNPNREGYKFYKWQKTETEEKIVYKAVYANNQYYIDFDSDGGTEVSKRDYAYDTYVPILPVPIKENHDFIGWTYEDELISCPFVYTYTRDITLKAKWKLRDKVLVEFYNDDGTLLKAEEVYYIEKASCDIPIRKGYSFDYWDKEVLEDKVIFKANYTVNSYRITFVTNSTQGIVVSNIVYNTKITSLFTPTKDNFIFMGWYLDDQLIELPYLYNNDYDIVLHARWEKSVFPSVSMDEYSLHIKKLNDVFSSAKQFHLENINRTNITFKHPLLGKFEIVDKTSVYSKVDKENYYFESKVSGTNIDPYYEIYRINDNIKYYDTLTYQAGKYLLESNIYDGPIDFREDEIFFDFDFTKFNSFRKIGENHYLGYTTLGLLKDDIINLDDLEKELGINKDLLNGVGIEIETIFSEKTNQFAISINLSDFSFKVDGINYKLDLLFQSFFKSYNEEIIPFDYNQENVIKSN